ncbi:MAG: DNA mismatch repair protein MutS [Bacillota bacterium]|nr:DNA mismatch repair protein MutS [Bacillota bacterium]
MSLRLADIDPEQLSPMMRQYAEQKALWPDCLLFFRLGDFYELFFEDAITASRALDITLTSRDCGLAERAPMCGVPYHAVDSYLARLMQQQFRVAICEQMADPATVKGLVPRQVTRVVTPGTISDLGQLDATSDNHVVAVYQLENYYGLAAVDITTGRFEAGWVATGATAQKAYDEILAWRPAELIGNEAFCLSQLARRIRTDLELQIHQLPDSDFETERWEAWLAIEEPSRALWSQAAAALLSYVERTQTRVPGHLHRLSLWRREDYLLLDANARRNLELTETLRDRQKRGSLLWAIDRTRTAMGARLLRRWLERPLRNLHDIRRRQAAVTAFLENYLVRQEIAEALGQVHDIERLSGRAALGRVHAPDLLALCRSLGPLPELRQLLDGLAQSQETDLLLDLVARLDPLEDIADYLGRAIHPEAPIALNEGHLIAGGFHAEVDRLRDAAENGQRLLDELAERERESTGIRNLKVGHNRVFGYYLEVSRGNLGLVPAHYHRRQTLANAERFYTDELKELEDQIFGARQRLLDLEYELFCEVRDHIRASSPRLQQTAAALAELDVLLSFAETADREHYCRPELDQSGIIDIRDGRHPVVERLLAAGAFVPNDCYLDRDSGRLMILTGPNMAGKSTFMRQTALIVLLAQMGSFVPASSCRIGITDRIFTRIGASDDLGGGQSTFMVEMQETAAILQQATRDSLVLLDEIGRGTSTTDGLGIARAVIEALADPVRYGCRSLFATHFHELTELESSVPGIVNFHSTVTWREGEIHFLHRIEPGGTDESFGIEVARLAGVPADIVERARGHMQRLTRESRRRGRTQRRPANQPLAGEQDLFRSSLALRAYDQIIADLRALDLNSLTPLDALNRLHALKEALRRLPEE